MVDLVVRDTVNGLRLHYDVDPQPFEPWPPLQIAIEDICQLFHPDEQDVEAESLEYLCKGLRVLISLLQEVDQTIEKHRVARLHLPNFYPDTILPPFLGLKHGLFLKHQLYQEIRHSLKQLGETRATLSTNLLSITREQQAGRPSTSTNSDYMRKVLAEWFRMRRKVRICDRPYFWDN